MKPVIPPGFPLARMALVLGLACALPASLPAQTAQISLPPATDHSEALKELRIMENIFDATLEAESERRRPRFSGGPDSLYLANQGMVFTFRLSNSLRGRDWEDYWQEFSFNVTQVVDSVTSELLNETFSRNPLPPAPPAPTTLPGQQGLNDPEQLRAEQEALRARAEAMRETQRGMQELQRELRELSRELRSTEADSARVESELAAVEAELETLRADLDSQREDYQRAQDEMETQRREAMENFSLAMTQEVISTLCDYGRTLRSLRDGEHVTLIFENFVQGEDQVLVFDYTAVRDCSSPEALLSGALRYTL